MTETPQWTTLRCPDCRHATPPRTRLGRRVDRLLRLAPGCSEDLDAYDAHGSPSSCDCRHPAHAH
ncbi:hypothetical protein [Nocardioides sp. AX2bis]|uniref:hypothetical protein n=1 Tax=Nocardioides sp. AX2bis TaxID=2653157 RepID=UPI00135772CB|nr:hypothetical protein [Nocardioides sp. AX2bis]